MERVDSGIPGLDKMIQGGFPFPSIVLVGGEPGTGKTTLALQSLFHGAEKGEQGLYITAVSEPTWVIQKFLGEFGFYSQKVVELEKIIFVDVDGSVSEDPEKIMDILKKNVEKYEPKRVVIDPITAIKNALSDIITYRKFLHDMMIYLKTQGCVTFLTTEYSYSDVPRSVDAYMVDALIILSYLEIDRMKGFEFNQS